jgi:hypothetical protein
MRVVRALTQAGLHVFPRSPGYQTEAGFTVLDAKANGVYGQERRGPRVTYQPAREDSRAMGERLGLLRDGMVMTRSDVDRALWADAMFDATRVPVREAAVALAQAGFSPSIVVLCASYGYAIDVEPIEGV